MALQDTQFFKSEFRGYSYKGDLPTRFYMLIELNLCNDIRISNKNVFQLVFIIKLLKYFRSSTLSFVYFYNELISCTDCVKNHNSFKFLRFRTHDSSFSQIVYRTRKEQRIYICT